MHLASASGFREEVRSPPICSNSGGHAHLGMDHRGNGFAPMLKIGCSHPSWLTNDCRNEERKVKVITKLVTLDHCAT